MIAALPMSDLANECKKLKICQQTIFGVCSLLGAVAIAIIYDGDTLLPIIAILGGTVGAVVGVKVKEVKG